jgi:hypothetical protein
MPVDAGREGQGDAGSIPATSTNFFASEKIVRPSSPERRWTPLANCPDGSPRPGILLSTPRAATQGREPDAVKRHPYIRVSVSVRGRGMALTTPGLRD